jgi:hypothetical protein
MEGRLSEDAPVQRRLPVSAWNSVVTTEGDHLNLSHITASPCF